MRLHRDRRGNRWALPGLAGLIGVAACGSSFDATVRSKLMQAVQTNPQRIDLKEYVTSPWDRVCVVTAGTQREEFERISGAQWPKFAAPDTAHVTLVFTRDAKAAEATELERRRGDFAAAGRSYCVARDSAVFRVTDTEPTDYRPIELLR